MESTTGFVQHGNLGCVGYLNHGHNESTQLKSIPTTSHYEMQLHHPRILQVDITIRYPSIELGDMTLQSSGMTWLPQKLASRQQKWCIKDGDLGMLAYSILYSGNSNKDITVFHGYEYIVDEKQLPGACCDHWPCAGAGAFSSLRGWSRRGENC